MIISSASFIISARASRQFPAPELPEFAFAGRSNAGKSTLLNSLTGKSIAKTSGSPGKTRMVNFFLINKTDKNKADKNACYFVDLPGYGFAVHGAERTEWEPVISEYITSRSSLRAVIVLLDSRHFILPNDERAIAWLETLGREYIAVLTKSDKLTFSELKRTSHTADNYFVSRPLCRGCIPFSSVNGAGKKELLSLLGSLT